MGVCISLIASTSFKSDLTPSGVYWLPKETTTFVLINTFIKIMLNAYIFLCILLLPGISVMSFLIANYLYIISYSYSILAVLICFGHPSSLRCLTHPLFKRHSQEFYFLKGMQKVVMSDDAAFMSQYPCFTSSFDKDCTAT